MQERTAVYLRLRQGEEWTDVSDGEEVESIGEMLFNVVHQLDPNHCADITGELLGSVEHRLLNLRCVCAHCVI